MGMILDTKDELLGLEERRESFVVLDLQRKNPCDFPKLEPFQPGRMFRGNDHYNYAVKKGGDIWLECGDNQYKAETTVTALNLLMQEQQPKPRLSEHIFVSEDGAFEVSKEFLRRLVEFFDRPDNRKLLEER